MGFQDKLKQKAKKAVAKKAGQGLAKITGSETIGQFTEAAVQGKAKQFVGKKVGEGIAKATGSQTLGKIAETIVKGEELTVENVAKASTKKPKQVKVKKEKLDEIGKIEAKTAKIKAKKEAAKAKDAQKAVEREQKRIARKAGTKSDIGLSKDMKKSRAKIEKGEKKAKKMKIKGGKLKIDSLRARYDVEEEEEEETAVESAIKINKCPQCGWILSSTATKCFKCKWDGEATKIEKELEEELREHMAQIQPKSANLTEIGNLKQKITEVEEKIKEIDERFAELLLPEKDYIEKKTSLMIRLGELQGKLSILREE